jgi:hypothetical protein
MRPVALASSLLLLLAACSTEPKHVSVTSRARFYNGATPHAVGSRANHSVTAAATPVSGVWLLSPDKITLHLRHIDLFTSSNSSTGAAVDCVVTYDKSQPGLTQLADCPFTIDTGTYTSLSLTFDGSMQMLVNDAANGFYSTATGIQTTAPAGGATPLAFTFPNNVNGQFDNLIGFTTPLVVGGSAGDSVASGPPVSIVINGLQFFRVTVSGGNVTLGGNGANEPQRPDMAAAVGTLAGIEFYARQDINTANSYCAFNCGGTLNGVPQGIMSVSMYYTAAASPRMVNLAYNGIAGNCTSSGIGFINSLKGYAGLDAAGNLGWAQPSDQTYTNYVSEFRMARVTTTGSTTTLYCKPRSGDPAPAGGNYDSGAPNIAAPANSLGTYVLLGK